MKKILLSLLVASPLTMFAQCTELFFSEYVEGTANSKALEIYNPTPSSVNLTGYKIYRYSNGSQLATDSLALAGTIAPHDVFIVVNGQTTTIGTSTPCDPALQALADQLDGVYPAPTYFNGNDALSLNHNGVNIDIFGKIGEDPAPSGGGWTNVFPYTSQAGGTWITENHTMFRHADVTQGVTVNPSAFNPLAEYDTLLVNTWTGLGTHVCNCNTSGIAETNLATVAIYPNPVLSNQSFTVTSSTAINSVEFYTLDGRKVKTVSNASASKTLKINTTDLQKNPYIIKTYTEGKQPAVTKIQVQ